MDNQIKISEKTNERNYGIDVLRILSMMMVVMLHVLGNGGIRDSTDNLSVNYEIAWFWGILANCAVNCFALISGYVGALSNVKYSNLVLLWLRVLFYSVGIAIVFKILNPDLVNIKGILTMAIPVYTKQYWYFTAYFLLFLFMPVLNCAIQNMERLKLKIVLITIIVCVSILLPVTSVLREDIWLLQGGYTPLWLIILYLVGGYIRKYGAFRNTKAVYFFVVYLSSAIITLLSKNVIQFVLGSHFEDMWLSYFSISMVVEAISLLLLFERFRVSKSISQKIISFFASLSFSVYLIHEHPFIREQILEGRFSWIGEKSPLIMIVLLLFFTVAIFVLCILIDCFRDFLFRILKIKQKLQSFEKKIFDRIKVKQRK